ncbi:MAG: ComEC/Rec2 family competence protein [Candidatus Andersenbacteria bacterium]
MYYDVHRHTRSQRTATLSLLALLTGLGAGTVLTRSWLLPALAVAAVAAAVLVLARRATQAVPLVLLLVGLLRAATGPPPPATVPPPTPAQRLVEQRLNDSVGIPESSLGASLLLGARSSVPANVVDDFRASGLSHVLAVSGYNVTLVANLLLWCGQRWLSRRGRTALVVLGVALFVLAAGASASVVRAGVMGGLAALALQSGRATAGRRTLLVAAAGMVLVQPSLLLFDVGFQLSAAATAAILLLAPRLLHRLRWLPDVLSIRTSLATTLAATLGTLPIIMAVFGQFAPAGLAANVVAAPLVPPAMAAASLAAVFGGSLPGQLVGYLASGLLRTLELVAHTFAQVPSLQLHP